MILYVVEKAEHSYRKLVIFQQSKKFRARRRDPLSVAAVHDKDDTLEVSSAVLDSIR